MAPLRNIELLIVSMSLRRKNRKIMKYIAAKDVGSLR